MVTAGTSQTPTGCCGAPSDGAAIIGTATIGSATGIGGSDHIRQRVSCQDRALKQAQSKVEPWQSRRAVDAARERLAEAEEAAQRHAFDRAVDGDTAMMPPSVAEARSTVAEAEHALETARRVRLQIDRELTDLTNMQPFRLDTVRVKARAVLAAELPQSKAVQSVLTELQQARQQLLPLARVARWFADQGAIEKNALTETLWAQPVTWTESVPPDERWQRALDALLTDADAPLP